MHVRRVRYAVASSLDGYIAGPHGESDWIPMDPDVDFGQILKQFDTLLVGSGTFAIMAQAGRTTMPGMRTIVFSHSLRQQDHPEVTIVEGELSPYVSALKSQAGKDIWLFGGGALFRSLLQARLVDTVELSIVPILLGGGIPLLPSPSDRAKLRLTSHRIHKSGRVSLEYAVM
jgi:dihydrofolate reductase